MPCFPLNPFSDSLLFFEARVQMFCHFLSFQLYLSSQSYHTDHLLAILKFFTLPKRCYVLSTFLYWCTFSFSVQNSLHCRLSPTIFRFHLKLSYFRKVLHTHCPPQNPHEMCFLYIPTAPCISISITYTMLLSTIYMAFPPLPQQYKVMRLGSAKISCKCLAYEGCLADIGRIGSNGKLWHLLIRLPVLLPVVIMLPRRRIMPLRSAVGTQMPRAECVTSAEQLVSPTIAVDTDLGICSIIWHMLDPTQKTLVKQNF